MKTTAPLKMMFMLYPNPRRKEVMSCHTSCVIHPNPPPDLRIVQSYSYFNAQEFIIFAEN